MHEPVRSAAIQNVRLQLASRPDDVQLARELLRGVAEATGIDVHRMDDVRTAVSEACNNVVQHAYNGSPGPIELDLALQSDALEVIVRDRGKGMSPKARPALESDTLGIGLVVIEALCERADLRATPGSGVEVRMRFFLPGLAALPPASRLPLPAEPFDPSGRSISLAIGPALLARNVLPRLLSAMAARAHFSTDRISDLQIVGDAIVAHCEPLIDGAHLCVRISAAPRTITLSVAPLALGGAAALLAGTCIEGAGGVVASLSDERQTLRDDSTERLVVRLDDHR